MSKFTGQIKSVNHSDESGLRRFVTVKDFMLLENSIYKDPTGVSVGQMYVHQNSRLVLNVTSVGTSYTTYHIEFEIYAENNVHYFHPHYAANFQDGAFHSFIRCNESHNDALQENAETIIRSYASDLHLLVDKSLNTLLRNPLYLETTDWLTQLKETFANIPQDSAFVEYYTRNYSKNINLLQDYNRGEIDDLVQKNTVQVMCLNILSLV